jgi:predicted amidohydrolase
MVRQIYRTGLIVLLVFQFFSLFSQNSEVTRQQEVVQTITSIRIASVSIIPDKWEKEKNWCRIEKMVRSAALDGGAKVVVTPEGALEGYVINQVNGEKDPEKKEELVREFLNLGEPLNGPYIKKATRLADELNIFLVLGFLERDQNHLLNSAIFINPDGEVIGKYSKTHFAQGYEINPSCYLPGESYPVFQTSFGKVGILICYDRQLPEPTRILALKGAQILFLPSYGSYTEESGWNTVLLRTRAYENRLPIVFSHPYQSLLINHQGDIKAIGQAGDIVYYEIDTSPERYEGRFRNRRPVTYQKLIE